jgi:hypothetical protein
MIQQQLLLLFLPEARTGYSGQFRLIRVSSAGAVRDAFSVWRATEAKNWETAGKTARQEGKASHAGPVAEFQAKDEDRSPDRLPLAKTFNSERRRIQK